MVYKKLFVFFLSLLLMVTMTPITSSSLSNDNCSITLTYQVGNKQYFVGDVPKLMDSEPEIKDSRMFLVIRFVTQHIPGTTLDWDGTERKVTIKTPGGKLIRLWIGSPKAEVNGKMVLIDPENPDKIVPYIKDGRTKLPMRFVGEQLEATIDWIASSSTVILTIQDIINCGCSWLEGCIVQWSEAPNNQYQLSFVLNCDKKSTQERYLVEKNVKSTTDNLELMEYLKQYPKPPYPTTKICLNQARKILKWDPVRSPGTNPPPPPDPPEPPDPPPTEKKGQMIIQVPKEFYYGTVIQITEQVSEDKKIYAVNTSGQCYTDYELICGGTYIVQPINHKVTFSPPSQTITIKKCWPESENITFDCKAKTCCDYELSRLTEPDLTLAAGESYSVMFMIKNNCLESGKNINFQLSPEANITSITPNLLTILSGQKKSFEVLITMPSTNRDQTTFFFKMETDCGSIKHHSFVIKRSTEEPPPEPTMKWICGCFSQFNSESADGTKIWLNANCSEPEGMWKTYMIPKNLKDQNLDLVITEYMTKYPLKKFKSLCIELYVDNKGAVEKWKATPEKFPDCCKPPEQKDPGRIIVSLGSKCVGVITSFASLSDPGAQTLRIEANIKGNSDSGCVLIFGDTYRVSPHSDVFKFTPEFIDIKITESCPDGIIRASFDAAEIPPSCCKWQFRLISDAIDDNWRLAPGETKILEAYEVINTCSLNTDPLQFTIDWPNDGKVISITPRNFTLKPSERQILKISIVMPENSVEGELIAFPFSIKPSGCDKKEVNIKVYALKFICIFELVEMKVLEINLSEGWVKGIRIAELMYNQKSVMAGPVMIHYRIGDEYWKKIRINYCYKICYMVMVRDSKPIKSGVDYRKIDCPE